MKKGKLLTEKEVAELCQVTISTLDNWVNGGYVRKGKFVFVDYGFPKPVKMGHLVRFYESDILAWINR